MEEKNEIIVYQPEGGEFHIEVRLENETVWLTQAQMAELFNATKQNVSLHISNIFEEGELLQNSTVKESLTVRKEGKREVTQKILLYNLKFKDIQNIHDRFIIVDEIVYHIGSSLNELGKKLTAFSVLNFVSKQQLLEMVSQASGKKNG